MLLSVVFIFLFAFLLLFLGSKLESKYYRYFSLVPLLVLAYFSFEIVSLTLSKEILQAYSWIPFLNINMNMKLDGLSGLFALIITGIGTLIFYYTSYYLKEHPHINRFYAYLLLFMGSMLGLVLADNLIVVFLFWELTSITSFFLIGFNNENEESRKGALLAFLITGFGGFFLLSAFLLIANTVGTYSIRELITVADVLKNSTLFPLILIFLFIGAFTKSAQFPFYFWLPRAMQAPTPVSAYLHSATMVKAGIYLLMRMFPILGGGALWSNVLMIVGGTTMLYGAFHSMFKKDLKAILAYSTVSALGIIVFLLGIGTEYAIYAAVAFVLTHALYKATLFLVAGIIDHATHTRNVLELSGLKQVMPIVFWSAFVAVLSSMGIMFTFGFISKDLIYETTLHLPKWSIILTGLAIITNVFIAYSGMTAGIRPFIGKLPEKFSAINAPNQFLWLPIVLLAVLSLSFGVFPHLADQTILAYAFGAIFRNPTALYLKIWHGFNLVLILSIITVILGVVLFFVRKYLDKLSVQLEKLENFSPQSLAENLGELVQKFAFLYTRFFQNGYLRNYIRMIILFMTILIGYRLLTTTPLTINTKDLSPFRVYEFTVFIIILAAIYYTVVTSSRLTAIASLGVIGFCICLLFVFYGAPDLAMTQFTIDTLTVVLFVLVLSKLPSFLSIRSKQIIIRDTIVSGAFGLLITLITLQALVYPASKETSKFFANNAYLLAKGRNIVNVILVDFRGADTMIETIVLSIAALGVYSLLKYKIGHEERD